MDQNYLVVENNVVTNICMWNGDISTWAPPHGATMLVQKTTPAVVWAWDETQNDCVLQEVMGAASAGFAWDGTKCITNQPKPSID